MPVVLARVDDRLIHGQIVEGWVPFLRADTILVVGDELCRDPERCRLMRMMVPRGTSVEVTSIAELGDLLCARPSARVLILFGTLQEVLAAVRSGVRLEKVNIGNLHHQRGGRRITPSVYLDSRDIVAVDDLMRLGVQVEAREVPQGRQYDLGRLICRGRVP